MSPSAPAGWPRDAVVRRVELPSGPRLHTVGTATRDGAAPFLLVHGLASNLTLWTGVAARLAAAGHGVVAVDLRHHGRSDPSSTLGTAIAADDLVHVARAWSLERPVAVGQSWGGNVVLELAARHPGLVRSVVGLDGGTIDLQRSFPDWDRCWAALAPPTWEPGVALTTVVAQLRDRMRGWPEGAVEAQLGNLALRPDGTVTAVLPRTAHEGILRDLWEHRPTQRAAHVRVPVLLAPVDTGDASWTSRKRDAVDAALAVLEVGRAVWLRDRDHDAHLQAPDEVTSVLLDAVADGFLDPPVPDGTTG